MENSSINGLIYQAVYIFIFITAVTITINLFNSVNNYVSKISESVNDDSISDAVTKNEDLINYQGESGDYIINGYELYTLINNYGMYKDNKGNYSYGAKYNGEKYSGLNYMIKVYIKDSGSSSSIPASLDNINLLGKYKRQNLSGNYVEFIEI